MCGNYRCQPVLFSSVLMHLTKPSSVRTVKQPVKLVKPVLLFKRNLSPTALAWYVVIMFTHRTSDLNVNGVLLWIAFLCDFKYISVKNHKVTNSHIILKSLNTLSKEVLRVKEC